MGYISLVKSLFSKDNEDARMENRGLLFVYSSLIRFCRKITLFLRFSGSKNTPAFKYTGIYSDETNVILIFIRWNPGLMHSRWKLILNEIVF